MAKMRPDDDELVSALDYFEAQMEALRTEFSRKLSALWRVIFVAIIAQIFLYLTAAHWLLKGYLIPW